MVQAAADNPFSLLSVATDASDRQVYEAWRKAAFASHPDRNPGDPDASERFGRIRDAYELLKTVEGRRAAAVEWLPKRNGGGSGWLMTHFDRFYRAVDVTAVPWARVQSGLPPKRGPDITRALRISLERSFRGGPVTFEHEAAQCGACAGGGKVAYPKTMLCPRCLGAGEFRISSGMVWTRQPCETCGGRGRVPWTLCHACGGLGQIPAITTSVHVPRGAVDGSEVVLPGLGVPGTGGGEPGDLVVRLQIAKHRAFVRDGIDLIHRISVPVWDAALGCAKQISGIDGENIDVAIPAGIVSGRVVDVPGRGMPDAAGRRGRLRVAVDIAVPAATDGAMRDLFVRMRDASKKK